jgi:hypothetical protein
MEAHRCVLCKVRTTSRHKNIKLSMYQAVEDYRVVRCLFTGLADGGKFVSLRGRPPFYSPQTLCFCFWYDFLLEAEYNTGPSAAAKTR